MNIPRMLKNCVKHTLSAGGYEIHKRPYLPKGTDVFQSLQAHWPEWRPRVIFDVGANVGQTVGRLRPLFPEAEIYAFEPVPATFATLKTGMRRDNRVHSHCIALAEQAGETWIQLHRSSELNSLTPELRDTPGTDGREVRLSMNTAAAFCAEHGITHIDLLKIDVEGFEISVLKGAKPLLTAGAVDYIVVEVGLMPGNPRFTPLPAMIEHLSPHGFWLVGIYEQFGHRYNEGAEFCNALFALKKHMTPGDFAPP